MRRSYAATAIASLVSERDWMAQLVQLAELRGYRTAHFRPARTAHGWRTPVSGALGEGWPDLFLARAGRSLFIECKGESTRLSPSQQEVHAWLRDGGCEVHVLRPSQLAEAVEILQ